MSSAPSHVLVLKSFLDGEKSKLMRDRRNIKARDATELQLQDTKIMDPAMLLMYSCAVGHARLVSCRMFKDTRVIRKT